MTLKKLAKNAVFEHIKNIFEMEMDNEIFKQNNADQVKGNATKLEYTNYGKNIMVLLLSFKYFWYEIKLFIIIEL